MSTISVSSLEFLTAHHCSPQRTQDLFLVSSAPLTNTHTHTNTHLPRQSQQKAAVKFHETKPQTKNQLNHPHPQRPARKCADKYVSRVFNSGNESRKAAYARTHISTPRLVVSNEQLTSLVKARAPTLPTDAAERLYDAQKYIPMVHHVSIIYALLSSAQLYVRIYICREREEKKCIDSDNAAGFFIRMRTLTLESCALFK